MVTVVAGHSTAVGCHPNDDDKPVVVLGMVVLGMVVM